jgi:hypothetical protein
MHIVTFPTSHKSIQVYHVTRTADLYMHGERRNFPPSRALGYDASCWRQGGDSERKEIFVCFVVYTQKGRGVVLAGFCCPKSALKSISRPLSYDTDHKYQVTPLLSDR